MAKGTKITYFYEKLELDDFLLEHDVLSVQHSHKISSYEYGKRHGYSDMWVVWYKEN